MDPHLLRTFIAVSDSGSFSAAASRLGYTQSAVSQQIALLEADLGTALLHRRPVSVTEAGERLLEHAGPILMRLDAARAEVARVAAPAPARLVLGLAPLAMTPGAPSALATACQAHPRLAVTLRVMSREAVPAQVAAGTLDLGLVYGVAVPSDPLRLAGAGPAAADHGLTVLPRAIVDAAPGITGVALSWPPLVHRTELVRGSSAGPAASAAADAMARV